MELEAEILSHLLSGAPIRIRFPVGGQALRELLEIESLAALREIQSIIADPVLDDPTCFGRIEAIVCALEAHGILCGGRHDFG